MLWSSESADEPPFPRPSRGEDGEVERWRPFARFANVAEAGYFADELRARLDVSVLVRSEQSFDALHHAWQCRFVLLAPEAAIERAEEALRALVDEGYDDAPAAEGCAESAAETDGLIDLPDEAAAPNERSRSETFANDPWGDAEREDSDAGRIHWLPIVLTLTAGSAAWCGLRWFQEPLRQAIGPRQAGGAPDLWNELSNDPAPWIQTTEGTGRRELRIDRQSGVAILTEDADGDGRPEREIKFPLPR